MTMADGRPDRADNISVDELIKLNREQLLRIMLSQNREEEALKTEYASAVKTDQERLKKLFGVDPENFSASICSKWNGLETAAQKTADLYIKYILRECELHVRLEGKTEEWIKEKEAIDREIPIPAPEEWTQADSGKDYDIQEIRQPIADDDVRKLSRHDLVKYIMEQNNDIFELKRRIRKLKRYDRPIEDSFKGLKRRGSLTRESDKVALILGTAQRLADRYIETAARLTGKPLDWVSAEADLEPKEED